MAGKTSSFGGKKAPPFGKGDKGGAPKGDMPMMKMPGKMPMSHPPEMPPGGHKMPMPK